MLRMNLVARFCTFSSSTMCLDRRGLQIMEQYVN